jgi:hypothetical protein
VCVSAACAAPLTATRPHALAPPSTTTTGRERSLTARPSGPARRAGPRAVATAFAAAYARYLQGRLPAGQLPACTPAAQAMIAQSGPLPARLRRGPLRLIGVRGGPRSFSARFLLTGALGPHALSAGLLLAPSGSGWEIDAVDPPDLDPVPPSPAPARLPGGPPGGPAAARTAALAFTDSWLAFTYGHAGASELQALSAALRSRLAASPPRVPTAIRALHPRVASLALTREGTRRSADANVTDGPDTYQVIALLARTHAGWLVIALRTVE